jgi:hypothetical protein
MNKVGTGKILHFRQTLVLTAILKSIIALLLIVDVSCKPVVKIINPYKRVNWESDKHYKANLHAHTTHSDGSFNPQNVVDRYDDLGYDILVLTDHNVITYPWQDFSTFKVSDRILKRLKDGLYDTLTYENDFDYKNRYPDSLGMITIQSSEISQHHHMGSYFNDYEGGTLKTVEESLDTITAKNGLAVLFHPGSYFGIRPSRPFHSIDWYVDMFRRYDHLIGVEAYNNGNNPIHINRWDSILIHIMPDRPVWGFSNDDFHTSGIGRNWNVFLLHELSSSELRRGMENGLFYFIYSPSLVDGPPPPVIESITVNSRSGNIHVVASGYQFIEWISDNKVVFRGEDFNINDFPQVKGYIRAVLYESENGPFAGTQPFGVRRR